jgi:hypothetical protein
MMFRVNLNQFYKITLDVCSIFVIVKVTVGLLWRCFKNKELMIGFLLACLVACIFCLLACSRIILIMVFDCWLILGLFIIINTCLNVSFLSTTSLNCPLLCVMKLLTFVCNLAGSGHKLCVKRSIGARVLPFFIGVHISDLQEWYMTTTWKIYCKLLSSSKQYFLDRFQIFFSPFSFGWLCKISFKHAVQQYIFSSHLF